MRTGLLRTEMQRLLRDAPFRPFAINQEKGDRLLIAHPVNVAFEPDRIGAPGSPDFYVLSASMRTYSTFDAVSSLALIDEGDLAAS